MTKEDSSQFDQRLKTIKSLEERYSPEKFKERFPKFTSNVYCGFSLPPGWGPILWRTLEKIEGILEDFKDLQSERGKSEVEGRFELHQVKEKFAQLRVYYHTEGVDDEWYRNNIDHAVDTAESASAYICEQCGTSVDTVSSAGGGYWLLTLCGACREDRELERDKDHTRYFLESVAKYHGNTKEDSGNIEYIKYLWKGLREDSRNLVCAELGDKLEEWMTVFEVSNDD